MDGSNFPGRTLYEIMICIQMFLEMQCVHWKLLDDPEFLDLHFTLDNTMKMRTQSRISQPVQQAEVLTLEQEEELWTKGILGISTPLQLLWTLLYVLVINLALCTGKEHKSLLSIGSPNSQLSFAFWNGQCVVIYKENLSLKTNQGRLQHCKVCPKTVIIYPSDNKSQCLVAVILKYHSKLSAHRKCPALYLQPKVSTGRCMVLWCGNWFEQVARLCQRHVFWSRVHRKIHKSFSAFHTGHKDVQCWSQWTDNMWIYWSQIKYCEVIQIYQWRTEKESCRDFDKTKSEMSSQN